MSISPVNRVNTSGGHPALINANASSNIQTAAALLLSNNCAALNTNSLRNRSITACPVRQASPKGAASSGKAVSGSAGHVNNSNSLVAAATAGASSSANPANGMGSAQQPNIGQQVIINIQPPVVHVQPIFSFPAPSQQQIMMPAPQPIVLPAPAPIIMPPPPPIFLPAPAPIMMPLQQPVFNPVVNTQVQPSQAQQQVAQSAPAPLVNRATPLPQTTVAQTETAKAAEKTNWVRIACIIVAVIAAAALIATIGLYLLGIGTIILFVTATPISIAVGIGFTAGAAGATSRTFNNALPSALASMDTSTSMNTSSMVIAPGLRGTHNHNRFVPRINDTASHILSGFSMNGHIAVGGSLRMR